MKDLKKIISSKAKEHLELYQKLKKEQNPHTLFITCSDSRIIPNIITSTKPGDLFLVRNVGNVVPTPDSNAISVLAAIEYAVHILKIENIVICGHSDCGAIAAVYDQTNLQECTHLCDWLKNIQVSNPQLSYDIPLSEKDKASQANTLQQIKNLSAHQFIKSKIEQKELELHAWWFDIGTVNISYFSIDLNKFIQY